MRGWGQFTSISTKQNGRRENLQKAYDLRDRVSERERFYIAAHHADIVTRDFEAARKIYEVWAQIYPRDDFAPGNLAVINGFLGHYDKALSALQAAHRLNPGNGNVLNNIAIVLVQLNRLEEAKAALREAEADHPDYPGIHSLWYTIDFLQHDKQAMDKEAGSLMGKPGWEDSILSNQSDTAAYEGHFVQARALTRRASDSARRADKQETASVYEAEDAVREALVGNLLLAKQQAQTAMKLSNNRDVEGISAIALGLAGESAQADRVGWQPWQGFSGGHHRAVQYSAYDPRGRDASRESSPAIENLATAEPYELGQTTQLVVFCLYPIYLRGAAYLAARQGGAAAAEFQKILNQPGPIQNELIGPLARLGLGRARALTGQTNEAKDAYQDFLTLWKDADSDIPILKEAKSEYAKLQ